MALVKFVIEPDIPEVGTEVGTFDLEQLQGAAAKSNSVLQELSTDVEGVDSYVATDKTFSVYFEKDEDIIRTHAEISGFSASRTTETTALHPSQ